MIHLSKLPLLSGQATAWASGQPNSGTTDKMETEGGRGERRQSCGADQLLMTVRGEVAFSMIPMLQLCTLSLEGARQEGRRQAERMIPSRSPSHGAWGEGGGGRPLAGLRVEADVGGNAAAFAEQPAPIVLAAQAHEGDDVPIDPERAGHGHTTVGARGLSWEGVLVARPAQARGHSAHHRLPLSPMKTHYLRRRARTGGRADL